MEKKGIGSVILATDQGLGYLAKAFYDNEIINEVLIYPHSTRVNHYDWYPNRCGSFDELIEKCHTIIFFETPFNWKYILKCRDIGIRTILIPMYECTQFPFPYEPDEVWCPSALDYQFYASHGKENIIQIQIPTDVEWRLRKKAEIFVHNAGNGGLGGRNGTQELIEAMKYVTSPIKLIIRSQVAIQLSSNAVKDERIEFKIGQFPKIWGQGDVFVFPEKFNGLSLPIQEAFASGMLVMATNRFPNNSYLPTEPLIKVDSYKKENLATQFDSAVLSPKSIAEAIDLFYNVDIEKYSMLGKEYNQKTSWKKQTEVLKNLLSA